MTIKHFEFKSLHHTKVDFCNKETILYSINYITYNILKQDIKKTIKY